MEKGIILSQSLFMKGMFQQRESSKIAIWIFCVAIPFYEGHVSTKSLDDETGKDVAKMSQSLFMKGMFQRLSLKSSLILACECLE